MTVQVREFRPGTDVTPFLDAAHRVFAGDPAWVPPLEMDMRDRLNPRKNPFFEHAEAALFVATRDGVPVGRISTSIDHEHLRLHQDDAGFFGFFDTIDDEEVARALLEHAEAWLRAHGMKRMRGPLSLSINEEVGLLIDGFEHPPFILTPHSRPYQGRHVEAAGLSKLKDFYAWRYQSGHIPKRARKAWQDVRAMPEVRIRSVDRLRIKRDVDIILDIFNDAWCDNWGFVPATPAEARKMAMDMLLIIDPVLSFIAEVDDEPVGMCVCLPNVNEVITDFEGKLSPVTFAKLLYRMKVKNPVTARVMLLGVKKALRGKKRYGGLSTALYVEVATRGPEHGYTWGELSWTLEDNRLINLGIKAMGGEVYKTYRVYEKPLDG